MDQLQANPKEGILWSMFLMHRDLLPMRILCINDRHVKVIGNFALSFVRLHIQGLTALSLVCSKFKPKFDRQRQRRIYVNSFEQTVGRQSMTERCISGYNDLKINPGGEQEKTRITYQCKEPDNRFDFF